MAEYDFVPLLLQLLAEEKKVEIQTEYNFTLKKEATVTQVQEKRIDTALHTGHDEISITEMTIEEALKARADERRQKMKDFNYKFHNNAQKIEELEKEPAYKRQNIELSQPNNSFGKSRTSLSVDSNNDPQLRSNNSFLHDNVD